MTKPSNQEDLFATSKAAGLVKARSTKPAVSRSQRAFNQLSAKIRREKERLAEAQQRVDEFSQRLLTSLQPVQTRIRAAQWKLLLGIDQWLDAKQRGVRLSRRDRTRLECLIAQLIADLLMADERDDPALVALREKYASACRPLDHATDIEHAEAMMGGLFGAEAVSGHTAQTVDELYEHVCSKFHEQERAAFEAEEQRRAAGRSKRGGPSKAALAQARKQAAAEQATASLRDIYRKLVSSLHPDREPDAAERERKTVLLQRANQAYERGDLMALFTLQTEIAQIDASHLANLPEERIKHYILMLGAQLRELQLQIAERDEALEDLFDLPGAFVDNRWIERSIKHQVKDAKRMLTLLEQDIRSISDPRQHRAFLDSLADPGQSASDGPDMDVPMAMLQDFWPPPTKPRKTKQGRRGGG